jgi:hypothetical protein
VKINDSTKDEQREAADSQNRKKPYTPPSFRFESVFEVSALACGKIFSSQGACFHSRKAS